MTEETIYFYGLDLKHMFLNNIWDKSVGPWWELLSDSPFFPLESLQAGTYPAPWKHRFGVCSLRSMGIAVTCNYFTVTCEEHPSAASSCRGPSLSPASGCSWIPCSRALVGLSPLMKAGCDLQAPEAEVPSVRIVTAWRTRSQVGIKLHRH